MVRTCEHGLSKRFHGVMGREELNLTRARVDCASSTKGSERGRGRRWVVRLSNCLRSGCCCLKGFRGAD